MCMGREILSRYDNLRMLRGHLDLSTTLVAATLNEERSAASGDNSWGWRFFDPFTPSLWVTLFAVILLSGLADFLVERRRSSQAKITKSLYEFTAGFLWGGFQEPLTRTSAMYQLMLGFIVIVVVSAYTANLTARC
jgi:hypothetical protein